MSQREQYDLEIDEIPVRDVCGSLETTRLLIEMMTWCYEARNTLSYAARDVLRSRQGETTGWMISETLTDGTPINPDTRAILLDLIERKNGDDWVIGGNFLEKAVRLMYGYGDAFVEVSLDREGLGSGLNAGKFGDYGICESLYLPTWQMFVKEDRQGRILEYQQRSQVRQEPDSENLIHYIPPKIIHFAHELQTKYGMSAFLQGVPAWKELKQVNFDIAKAVRALGVNPNVHVMPEGKDEAYKKAYQKRYESLVSAGVVTDLFLLHGADVRKMMGVNSNLDALFRRQLDLRYHITPAGFPVWFFPGLGVEMRGAREISGEPAKAYNGILASVAFVLSKGIRKVFDLELRCRLGEERFKRDGKYRIIFPDFGSEAEKESAEPVEDEDSNDEAPDKEKPEPESEHYKNGFIPLFKK